MTDKKKDKKPDKPKKADKPKKVETHAEWESRIMGNEGHVLRKQRGDT